MTAPHTIAQRRDRLFRLCQQLTRLSHAMGFCIHDTARFFSLWLAHRALYGPPTLTCQHQQDSVRNARCAVVMNGPSAGKIIGHHHGYEAILVCNQFVHSGLFSTLKPTHYFLADPDFYRAGQGQAPHHIQVLTAINAQTEWPMNVFLPTEARALGIPALLDNPQLNTVYFSKEPLTPNVLFARTVFEHTSSLPTLTNVAILALAWALKCQARQVDLYGADLSAYKSFTLGADKSGYVNKDYFFQCDWQHSPVYQNALRHNGRGPIGAVEFFQEVVTTLKAHRDLRHFRSGTQITNMSDHSIIDAWDFHDRR